MAIVKRESGAWKAVVKKLKQEGVYVSKACELQRLLDDEQIKHFEFSILFKQKRQEADKRYNDELSEVSVKQNQNLVSIHQKYNSCVQSIKNKIDELQRQRSEIYEKGFFYRLFHFFDVKRISKTVKQLDIRREKIILKKDKKIIEHVNFFENKKLEAKKRWNEAVLEYQKKN